MPVFLPGKSHGQRSPCGHFLPSFMLFSRVAVQFHRQCIKVPFCLHPCWHLLSLVSLMLAILMDVRWYLIVVYICISLMTSSDEYLFMCLSQFSISFLEKCLFSSIAHFIVGLFYFIFDISCMNSLHILAINPLSDMWLKILLPFCMLSFYF